MKKHIFDLLISLLKEPEWRSELPRVVQSVVAKSLPIKTVVVAA